MTERDALGQDEHSRVFKEEILPEYRLSEKTSLESPKAIILAGQPGSRKKHYDPCIRSQTQYVNPIRLHACKEIKGL
jgi:hypothetical protein